MFHFFATQKFVWQTNRAIEEVGIKSFKLGRQFRLELRNFALANDLRPEELAAVLVRKEGSLLIDLFSAIETVSKWRHEGKIRDSVLEAAFLKYDALRSN